MTRTQTGRGRPPASSRDMLQDAAFDLFLENSYAGTTVDQITQRAGVSRNTFFNYFPAKSDVFWVDLDQALDELAARLKACRDCPSPLVAVHECLITLAREFDPARVPFALTQHTLIGSVHELQASALTRFVRQAKVLSDFLQQHPAGLDAASARAVAYAALAATVAAAQSWAAASTTRGSLEPYLRAALDPVIAGFQAAG